MAQSGRSGMHGRVPIEWTERAAGTGSQTATRAAEANRRHYLMGVIASHAAADIQLLTITYTENGVVKTIDHYVHNAEVILFGMPVEADENTPVTAEMPGTNEHRIVIWGYTLSSRSAVDRS